MGQIADRMDRVKAARTKEGAKSLRRSQTGRLGGEVPYARAEFPVPGIEFRVVHRRYVAIICWVAHDAQLNTVHSSLFPPVRVRERLPPANGRKETFVVWDVRRKQTMV